ncbi:hypothetical protein TcCL_ESM10476 [Trypanosoma cruzi]|nr:hypothetical protein TcCL_ESM10476 [Trypanosoma cruzi]
MAAACGCHSVLSGNMLPRFHVCVVSETMCWRLCDCRVEGEEWREMRDCRGQESRWVSRRGGHCPPTQPSTAPVGHPLSLRSIVVDASSTQRGSGCHHRHECDRKGTRLLLRSEEALVWNSGVPTTSSRSLHTTPGTGRGVFASWRTLRWSLSFQMDGRLFFFFFPPRRMAARWNQNKAAVFTMEGHYLKGTH